MPTSPHAWCRRLLTLLKERKQNRRTVPYLEMLLAFFVDQNPSRESFAELLGQYRADACPEIGDAAALLLRSWLLEESDAATRPLASLQETLRTVGGLLDDAHARVARLVVSPDGMQLETFGDEDSLALGVFRPRFYEPVQLLEESAARRALRGHIQAADARDRGRYEAFLRRVGEALDREPSQIFELVLTPRLVVAEGSLGYYGTFPVERLGPPPFPTPPLAS